MNAIRFGAQELGIGTISPKMVEPKLEGDKVVDLDHHNLREELPLLLPSIFISFPFYVGFTSSSPMEAELIFVTLDGGCWMEGKASPSTHVQSPK